MSFTVWTNSQPVPVLNPKISMIMHSPAASKFNVKPAKLKPRRIVSNSPRCSAALPKEALIAWNNFEDKAPKLRRQAAFLSVGAADDQLPPLGGLVRVFSEHEKTSFACPWLRDRRRSVSCGFVIEGRRVLTCSSFLEHNSKVTIKTHASPNTFQANILAIADECDIAMLTVDDEAFWEKVIPVEFGDMPAIKDELIAAGFSPGEDSLFTQNFLATNLEVANVSYWPFKPLALQAQIKPLIMVLPFLLTFWGKVIPIPVIKHILEDYDKNGAYNGFPTFAVKWQKMENLALRKYMKMEDDQQGILIRELHPQYPESLVLRPNDIILSIDGFHIAKDGTAMLMDWQRVPFSYLITQKYIGDEVAVEVLRNSAVHQFKIKLAPHKQLMPTKIMGRLPSYYIIAGLVFTTLSLPYLRYGRMFEGRYVETLVPDRLLTKALYEQAVVICEVLKADINHGFEEEDIVSSELVFFNDKPVESLQSLVAMVEGCDEEYLKFVFENGQMVVVKRSAAQAANPDILHTYGIHSAASEDLSMTKQTTRLVSNTEKVSKFL